MCDCRSFHEYNVDSKISVPIHALCTENHYKTCFHEGVQTMLSYHLKLAWLCDLYEYCVYASKFSRGTHVFWPKSSVIANNPLIVSWNTALTREIETLCFVNIPKIFDIFRISHKRCNFDPENDQVATSEFSIALRILLKTCSFLSKEKAH